MSNYRSLVEETDILLKIGRIADQLGTETYVVGGFVRDHILSRKVKKDIDIVCIGSGIKLAQEVKKVLSDEARLSVYKNFGTAAIHFQELELEFVGARKESYRKDSRKPIVEDGSLEDDQNRRDFTINAMAISLNEQTKGQLLDPFDGVNDLRMKMVRTPLDPSITFSDDPLRMMRAIRFATQLGFDIDPDTYDAIGEMKGRLDIVSQERITDELNKIILSPKPSYGFKLLFSSGILESIFPELHRLQGVQVKNGQGHKDNFYHTLQVLDNVSKVSDSLWLRWAALLHDVAKPATQRFNPKVGWTFHGHEDLGARWVPRIFKRHRLPMNESMKYVRKLVRLHLRPIALVKDEVTDSAIRRLLYEAGDEIEDLMTLCRADITSKNDQKVKRYLANFDKVWKRIQEVEEKDQIRNFKLPVTGEDIMTTFGLSPSRTVGDIKDEIKEAILEGVIPNDREEALKTMFKIGERLGLVVKDN